MKKTSKITAIIIAVLTIMCLWAFSANAAKELPTTPEIGTAYALGPSSVKINFKLTGDENCRVFVLEKGKWKTVGNGSIVDGSYTVKDLTASTEYTFAVRTYLYSFDGIVWSEKYDKVTVKTKDMSPAPVLTAVADETSVELSWTETVGATGYRILRYNVDKWVKVADVTKENLKYTVTGLEGAKNYIFMIAPYAINTKGGVWGDFSNYVSVTTKNPLIAELEATADENSITLSWDKVEKATGYRVFIRENNKWKALKTLGGTTYTVTGLESDKFYTLCVRAYQKVDGTYNWFPFESFKWATAPSEEGLTAYRTEKYDEIFQGNFLLETITVNDKNEVGYIGFARRNGYTSKFDKTGLISIYNARNGKEYWNFDHVNKTYYTENGIVSDFYTNTPYRKAESRGEITVSIEEFDGKKVVCESFEKLNMKLYFIEDTLIGYEITNYYNYNNIGNVTTRYYVTNLTTQVPTSYFAIPEGYKFEMIDW